MTSPTGPSEERRQKLTDTLTGLVPAYAIPVTVHAIEALFSPPAP